MPWSVVESYPGKGTAFGFLRVCEFSRVMKRKGKLYLAGVLTGRAQTWPMSARQCQPMKEDWQTSGR